MRAAATPYVGRVSVEYRLVVRFSVLRKNFDHLRIRFVSVRLERSYYHAQPTIRHDCPFEWGIGLESNDDFILAIDIPWLVSRDGAGNLGDIEDSSFSLFYKEFVQSIP